MQCPKCNAIIFIVNESKNCPECGYSLVTKKTKYIALIVFIVFCVMMVKEFYDFKSQLSPFTIEAKSNSLNFIEIAQYSSSLKGQSVQWKSNALKAEYKQIDNMFSVNAKIINSKNLVALFYLDYETGKSIKHSTLYQITGKIKNVSNIAGITMVQLIDTDITTDDTDRQNK